MTRSATAHVPIRLLAIPGSLRRESFNRSFLANAVQIAEAQGALVDPVDFKRSPLPFFDADLETDAGLPPEVEDFRARLAACDGVLIAAPEYNGSMSAVLKNAIDWASRKRPTQPWDGKPVLLLGASPGGRGARRVLEGLTAVMANVRATLAAPPLGLAHAQEAFDAEGRLQAETTRQELQQRVDQLLAQCALLRQTQASGQSAAAD